MQLQQPGVQSTKKPLHHIGIVIYVFMVQQST